MHASPHHAGCENQAWPDRRIAALAERQGANLGHAQLLGLGVRPSTIAAALARGRLHAVHHGVHSLVPPGAQPPLEYDSDLHHSGDRARERDGRRHNDLTAWGYDVLHVSAADMRHPERVLVWVTAALTRNGWSPAAA